MSQYVKLFFILLYLLFFHAGAHAQIEEQTKVYPLPLAETEVVISDWLGNSGFAVRRSSPEEGKIIFYVLSAEGNWHVLLKQQSALATRVQVLLGTGEQPSRIWAKELLAYISAYIGQPSSKQGFALEDADIPATVLSHKESVVCISEKNEDGDMQCSGFIVDNDGLIICTAHDLKDHREVTVSFYNGDEVRGRVIKIDPRRDLSLIRINSKLDAHIPLEGGRTVIGIGEKLYSIGCPDNLIGTVFSGAMNGPQRRADDQIYWQVNMKIYPGSSGSPVFDGAGNLAAVVKGRYRGTDSVGFLITLGTVLEFMK